MRYFNMIKEININFACEMSEEEKTAYIKQYLDDLNRQNKYAVEVLMQNDEGEWILVNARDETPQII